MVGRTSSQEFRAVSRGPECAQVLWVFDLGHKAYLTPLVAQDGSVYVATASSLVVLDSNGVPRWSREFDQKLLSGGALLRDGSLVIADSDGVVHCVFPGGGDSWVFDPLIGCETMPSRMGMPLFPESLPATERTRPPALWPGSVTVLEDDSVVLCDGLGRTIALDQGGHLLWEHHLEDALAAGACVHQDGTVYGIAEGRLAAMRPDGREAWQWRGRRILEGPVTGPFSLWSKGNVVYAGTGFDHGLLAVSTAGDELWRSQLGRPQGPIVVAEDGRIAFPTIGCVNSVGADGTHLWTRRLYSTVCGHFAFDARGWLYFGTGDGVLLCVNEKGDVVWSHDAEAPILSGTAIGSDGRLYVVTKRGSLICMAVD
jgi:outer membrane protein assembly factor BamB